jgi:UDP-N-acetylmuramoyl-L-alanyl-D-glutamate--2,6-diaminopimelate ligase
MLFSELLRSLPGEAPGAVADRDVTGLADDSRRVRPGDCFVAVPGEREDGARYIPEAVARGAVAVVAARIPDPAPGVPCVRVRDVRAAAARLAGAFFGHPSERMDVAGITGTKGKTTTAFFLRSILEAAGRPCGLIGTVRYVVGTRTLPAPNTTPGPVVLQGLLAEMAASGSRAAAVEVSSHALVQRRVEGVRFRVGIFTNLAQDHLDYHGTLEAYRDAKGLLFASLEPGATAVLHVDDPASAHYRSLTRVPVVGFGLGPGADVGAEIHAVDFRGTRLTLRAGAERVPVATRLLGRHNVCNLLAAAAAARAMGVDLDAIRRGVEALDAVPGRLEPVDAGQDFAVMVDYAHTEASLRNVLECLRPLARARLVCVFGCGGDRDHGKRPAMGRVAEALADAVILTSDNPRSEDPEAILAEIRAGMREPGRARVMVDRRAAIREAVDGASAGDIVLIAGKGHETVQVFRDVTLPFDDRLEAREALRERLRGRV